MLTRRMITRGVRRQNKARREFLQEARDGLIVFGNACNSVANARKFFGAFAAFLQGRFSPFWCLQNFCKGPFSHFGVCRTSASALFPILAFAGLLQGPFSPFWRLQNFCKRAFSHFGVCRTSASALFPILVFAEVLQTPKSFSRHLQRCCKAFPKALRCL